MANKAKIMQFADTGTYTILVETPSGSWIPIAVELAHEMAAVEWIVTFEYEQVWDDLPADRVHGGEPLVASFTYH